LKFFQDSANYIALIFFKSLTINDYELLNVT